MPSTECSTGHPAPQCQHAGTGRVLSPRLLWPFKDRGIIPRKLEILHGTGRSDPRQLRNVRGINVLTYMQTEEREPERCCVRPLLLPSVVSGCKAGVSRKQDLNIIVPASDVRTCGGVVSREVESK